MLRAWFDNLVRMLEPSRGFTIWGGYANVANYPASAQAHRPVLLEEDHLGKRACRSHSHGLHRIAVWSGSDLRGNGERSCDSTFEIVGDRPVLSMVYKGSIQKI
jgi:hypothetical protein